MSYSFIERYRLVDENKETIAEHKTYLGCKNIQSEIIIWTEIQCEHVNSYTINGTTFDGEDTGRPELMCDNKHCTGITNEEAEELIEKIKDGALND